MTDDKKASPIDRIHSTKLTTADGNVVLSRTDYDRLYACALRGQGQMPAMREPSDLPTLDGLGILDIGIFDLPEGSGAHSEFRVWLNNNQRVSYAIPASRRLYWFDMLVRAFFRGDLERAV